MFFSPELLSKRDSGIGLLWMAATLGKTSIAKLNRRNVLSANISKLCELVAEPAEPLALRLSSNLLVGVVRVYKVKHDIFLSEVTTCFTSLKRTILEINAAETSAALNLAAGSVRPDTITLAVAEPGTGMGVEIDFGGLMWEDFINHTNSGGRSSSPPGITSQDFSGTQTQTQTQPDRPLYTLEESYDFLAPNEPELGLDVELGGLGEDFDLGLGQDAFGDVLPMEGLDDDLNVPSSPTKRRKLKPKNAGADVAPMEVDPNIGQMYARESSVPFQPLNLDDWAADLQPSSSGFGLPGSGGVGLASSRLGSVEPHRFQSVGPLGEIQATQPEPRPEGDHVPAPAPKKPKKKAGVVQDKRTELSDEELIANRNNYIQEQTKLRIEVELRRQERDAARVIDVWMEGVPYGFNCPALDDWFKESFKALINKNSNRRKRDEDDGFAVPPIPSKRRREETPSLGPEIGRNVGTPMNFGDEFNWGAGVGLDAGFIRSSSIEAPEVGMRESQVRDDLNLSQRSSLLPWDNIGVSTSTNGDAGGLNIPGDANRDEHVTVRQVPLLKSASRSGRESSAAPSRLSASPGRFGPGLDAFNVDAFELGEPVEERPTQVEVTMERNSFKFLEYARMQTRALADPSGGVMFSSIAPKESSTAHVAATAFYHTLVLATKSAVRVDQPEPFADFIIYTL